MGKLLAAALASIALVTQARAGRAEARGPFVTLDRITPPSRLGIDASMLLPEANGWIWRVDAHFHYLTRIKVGGYAQIGYTQWNNDLLIRDIIPGSLLTNEIGTRSATGNLEAGLFHVLPVGEHASLTSRVGVVLPTGPSPSTGWNFLANGVGAVGRIADLEQFSFWITWLRLGFSVNAEQGDAFFQADLSASFGFETDDRIEANDLVHANLGAGYALGPVAIMVEVAAVTALGGDGSALVSPALSVRLDTGALKPNASVIVPFDTGEGRAGTVYMIGMTHSF